MLWPPNENMREVTLSYAVYEATDPNPEVQITSVTCNEASFSGADYAIPDTDPEHLVQLQAKREDTNQAGRIYTITVTATDAQGNFTESQCTVWVPHDMRDQGA